MPAVRTTFRSQNHRGRSRQDSPALAVAFSVLQLMAIAFVWLVALLPLALMALGAAVFGALKLPTRPTPPRSGTRRLRA
jgi:hypothetical protein